MLLFLAQVDSSRKPFFFSGKNPTLSGICCSSCFFSSPFGLVNLFVLGTFSRVTGLVFKNVISQNKTKPFTHGVFFKVNVYYDSENSLRTT